MVGIGLISLRASLLARKKFFILLGLLLVCLFVLVVVVVDPFRWGEIYSSKFTWDKFEKIQTGESILVVMDSLGKPVSPPGPYRTNMPGGALADCGEPTKCDTFRFSKTIFIGGREAVVVASSKDGRVLAKWVNREP